MNSNEQEKQHGQLLPLRDKFWYDRTAKQFGEDLWAIKQDIMRYELGLLPKNSASRCWHVCINAPTVTEDTYLGSSGSSWSRRIDVSYIFFYIIDEPRGWFYKLFNAPHWKLFLDIDYWKGQKHVPVWHTSVGSVSRTIRL